MQNTKTRNLVATAFLAALICVCAVIVVPFGPVPFTMAVFAVCLAGAMLPPPWAAAAVGVYLLLGFVGLPVFSGFQAGPQVLFGPTGGYLVGYFWLALAVSIARRRGATWLPRVLGAALGVLLCHLFGTLWFVALTGNTFGAALMLCSVPFLLPDALKCALAYTLAAVLHKRLGW